MWVGRVQGSYKYYSHEPNIEILILWTKNIQICCIVPDNIFCLGPSKMCFVQNEVVIFRSRCKRYFSFHFALRVL